MDTQACVAKQTVLMGAVSVANAQPTESELVAPVSNESSMANITMVVSPSWVCCCCVHHMHATTRTLQRAHSMVKILR